MRIVSAKSLCLLFGFLAPCIGAATPSEAGVIPWLYDSIFGYGWGGGYGGGGYGGGMAYGANYGGGYGMGYSAPMYSAPVYSAPTMSSPIAPTDGTYNAHYGPSMGYYDSGYGYGSSYVVNSGNCCNPCAACSTGGCATPVESGRPAPNPTRVDEVVPVVPKNKTPQSDDFGPTNPGRGLQGTGVRQPDLNGEEALPETERRPMRRPADGAVEPMVPPVDEEAVPLGPEVLLPGSPAGAIAVRYVPTAKRSLVVIPRSTARVVRIDRATREQLSQSEPKPQLASNP